MADMETRRLKRLARRYRVLLARLLLEGVDYTTGQDCVFCSGYEGHKSADETEDGGVRHSRRCPIRQAEKLAAEVI